MNKININNLNDFISVKNNIESDKEKTDIQSFINDLNLQSNIFVEKENVIPFSIKYGYLFYISTDTNTEHSFLEIIDSVNYNVKNLLETDIRNLHNYDNYFIIDSKYKVINK